MSINGTRSLVGHSPPQNLEAERSLLGAWLLDPAAIDDCADLVSPGDFYRDSHRVIAGTILDMRDVGLRVDAVTLADELERRKEYLGLGGDDTLLEIANSAPHAANAKYHAQIVRQKAIARETIQACTEVISEGYSNCLTAAEILELAERRIFAIADANASAGVSGIGEITVEVMMSIERRRAGDDRGLMTGFMDLDDLLDGLKPAEMVILAARPSQGKTAMAVSIIINSCIREGSSVLFASMEMNALSVGERILSSLSGVDSMRMRKSWLLSDSEKDSLSAAAEGQSSASLTIYDRPHCTASQIAAVARRLKSRRGLDLVVIDYLSLMDGQHQKGENRQEEVARLSLRLKGMARELNVPVLCVHQLNRQSEAREDKRPRLSDLRECVTGDTRLIDAGTGLPVEMRDVRAGDRVLSVDCRGRIVPGTVSRAWSTGIKPVFKLTTNTGKSIVATVNHPLRVADGWRELGGLHIGDVVGTAMSMPVEIPDDQEKDDLCRLVGYLVGDGTFKRHREVGFISADTEVMDDCTSIVVSSWPEVRVRHKKPRGNYRDVSFSTTFENGYGRPGGNPLRQWLRHIGIEGQWDATKRVPDFVFGAGASGIKHFLAGYLATDGCVKVKCRYHGQNYWGVHFDTVSRGLADDVQILLTRIGVMSSVSRGYTSKKSTQPLYRIAVATAAENLFKFAAKVPVVGKKAALLSLVIGERPGNATCAALMALPVEVSALVATMTRDWRDQGKRMRRDVCAHWAERLNDDGLRDVAHSDLLWERVDSIEPAGHAEVFDISIPEHGCFIGNGIIAHNSGQIEQDADAVLLLHRPDYYNPNDQPGVAEVIVAKNRNGPTGTVRLMFTKQCTRFETMPVY